MTAFAELCQSLLADVRERLIFRSYVYIKQQILGYEPSPGDLCYPEKLEMMNVSPVSVVTVYLGCLNSIDNFIPIYCVADSAVSNWYGFLLSSVLPFSLSSDRCAFRWTSAVLHSLY